jgi:hypothetical protein
MPGCSAAWVGSCANSAGVTSGVRILILSFEMPRGSSLAAARWAADRDLKTPTTGFIIRPLSGGILLEHWGAFANNQVFAGTPRTRLDNMVESPSSFAAPVGQFKRFSEGANSSIAGISVSDSSILSSNFTAPIL